VNACETVRRHVAAYLDGELIGPEHDVIEQHLPACQACRDLVAAEGRLHAAISSAIPAEPASAELRRHLDTLLGPGSAGRTPRRRFSLGLAAAAALALIATLLAIPRGPERTQPNSDADFTNLAVDSHLRYAAGRLPLEIRSERPDEISRWFSGRVPFNLTLPDYPVGPGETKFYTLEGARLVGLSGDYAAYVAYRMEGRPISLLVSSARTARPAGRETVRSGELVFHLDELSGLKLISWTDNGLTYALASDLSVSGAGSCLVCHGAPEERRKLEGLASPRL